MRKLALLAALLALCFVSPSNADRPGKLFGVMDDNPVMGLASQGGFNTVKKTVWITPTQWHWKDLDPRYQTRLIQDMTAAKQDGINVILELYPVGGKTPSGPNQKRYTCDLAKDLLDKFPDTYGVEVGVEPNSSTFWKPQFKPDGTQASAAAYEQWLAACYDIIKSSHPDVQVIGGSLSSRGEDDPYKPGSDTSPVLFIQKLCAAVKTTGRTQPLMDMFDMHTYPDPEDQDPAVAHPYPSTTITIADGDKLDKLLGCFTAAGLPKPPYIWGEGGYNTVIPASQKQYKGVKPASVRTIDEATQARYFAEEVQMAYCQPHSRGFINLHMVDDANRAQAWQSGFAYAPARGIRTTSSGEPDYTTKSSWSAVQTALQAASDGSIKCG